jgi:hypothetical protein
VGGIERGDARGARERAKLSEEVITASLALAQLAEQRRERPDLGDRARVARDLLLKVGQLDIERAAAVGDVGARESERVQRFLERGVDDLDVHQVALDRRQHRAVRNLDRRDETVRAHGIAALAMVAAAVDWAAAMALEVLASNDEPATAYLTLSEASRDRGTRVRPALPAVSGGSEGGQTVLLRAA